MPNTSKLNTTDRLRLTQARDNFCNVWGEYYWLYRSVLDGQPKSEEIDRKYSQLLPSLDHLWNQIKPYLPDEWHIVDACRFYFELYTNLKARQELKKKFILPNRLSKVKPSGKVEDYKSCKSLLTSYSYNYKDLFKGTPWNPESYYTMVLEAAIDGLFMASEFPSSSEPDKAAEEPQQQPRQDKTAKKRKPRISDRKFKQLCREVKKEFPLETHGGKIFFKELATHSKLPKYDKTEKGHTPSVVRNRYYKLFPSKKRN